MTPTQRGNLIHQKVKFDGWPNTAEISVKPSNFIRSPAMAINVVITPAVHMRTDANLLCSCQTLTPLPQAQAPDCPPVQQRPGNARHLIGDRHRHDPERFAFEIV